MISLRMVSPENFFEIVEMSARPDASLWCADADPATLAQGFRPNSRESGLVLYVNQHKEVVGFSSYGVNSNNTAWFSLYLKEEFRRQGLSRTAMTLMTDYVFHNLGASLILHNVMIDNVRMISTIKKIGCRYVGPIRSRALFVNRINHTQDCKSSLLYELTVIDWQRFHREKIISSQFSYGIHDPVFKASEMKRLSLQNRVQQGEFENRVEALMRELPVGAQIVDLGCGNGVFLKALASRHVHQNFVGVDTDPDFLALAKAGSEGLSNLKFIQKDILELTDTFQSADLILVRIVAQHLGRSALIELLTKIKKYGKPKTRILFLDVDDRFWTFEPEIEGIELLLNASQTAQETHGGDRKIGLKIREVALSLGLSITHFKIFHFDSHSIGLDVFAAIAKPILMDKPDESFLDLSDKEILLQKLTSWKSNPTAFGSCGLVMTEVQL